MDPNTLLFLVSYAIGIGSNASWDAIKYVLGRVVGSRDLNFEQLWIDAFFEALDIHSKSYDEIAASRAKRFGQLIRVDPAGLVDAVRSVSYEDYGVFLAALDQYHFQQSLAQKLIHYYRLKDADSSADAFRGILSDVIACYKIALFRRLSRDEEQRIVLLQTLKIDSIKSSLEELHGQIVTKDFFSDVVSDATSAIADEIKQYLQSFSNTYNNSKVEIETLSLATEKELLVKDLRRLLKAKGFQPLNIQQTGIDLVAETRGVIETRIALKVDVGSSATTLEDVLSFRALFPRTRSLYGYYVSKSGFEAEALRESIADPSLKLYSADLFTTFLVDFDEYINGLISTYETRDLVRKRLYQAPLCFGDGVESGSDLLASVGEFVRSDESRMMALLGDFGTGKTTFCEYYVYLLAKRYLDKPHGNRIPVLVPLRKYDRVSDIRATIVQTLQQLGVDINLSLFAELQRGGRFVFVFDGFDEMTLRSDKLAILQNLRALEETIQVGDNKAILTCRTHFFRDGIDEDKLRDYRILNLQDWTKRQLDAYLKESIGEERFSELEHTLSNPSLRELSRTPLFLQLIVDSVSQIDNSIETVADLFGLYTDKWLNDQDYRSRMTSSEKRAFMGQLARLLFYEDRFSVHYSELREVVRQTFRLQVVEDVDYFDNDVRTCSFLVRDTKGNYGFSHRAFLEFFVARELASELPGLWRAAKRGRRLDKFYFHRKKLSHEMYAFLAQMKPDTNVLPALPHLTRGKTFRETKYLASNAITVLRCMKYDLRGADLSDTVLCDADFSGLDITGANLARADLYTSNFNNCTLDDVDMTGAKLGYASIKGLSGILDIIFEAENEISCLGTLNRPIALCDLTEDRIVGELQGHAEGVWALAQLGMQARIVSGGRDHTVRMWDLRTRDILRTFEGHFDNVWCVSSNKSGTRIASGSSDRLIKVWDVNTSSPELTLEGHKDEVRDVCFLTDDKLISCGLDGRIIVWNLVNGSRSVWKGAIGLHSLALSSEQEFLVVGDSSGFVMAFHVEGLDLVWKEKIHEGAVRTLAFGSSGHEVISGGGDNQVYLTDFRDPAKHLRISGHKGFVNRVRVDRTGKKVISVGYDNVVTTTNLETGEQSVLDLTERLYGRSNQFSCKGLVLRGVTGLSPERTQYLVERGAVS